jgi:hypothetical protein
MLRLVRRTRPIVTALLVGGAVAVVVLTGDVLLGPRIGPPLWTCISSGPPTTTPVPAPSGDPSIITMEDMQSYSQCTDRVGVPLALLALVTSTAVAYRRARRL